MSLKRRSANNSAEAPQVKQIPKKGNWVVTKVPPFEMGITRDFLGNKSIGDLAKEKNLLEGRIKIIIQNSLTHIKNTLAFPLKRDYLEYPARYCTHWLAIINYYETICELNVSDNKFSYFLRYFSLATENAKFMVLLELDTIRNERFTKKKKQILHINFRRNSLNNNDNLTFSRLNKLTDFLERKDVQTDKKEHIPIEHLTTMTNIWLNLEQSFEFEMIENCMSCVPDWLNTILNFRILTDLYKEGSIFCEYAKYYHSLPYELQCNQYDQIDALHKSLNEHNIIHN